MASHKDDTVFPEQDLDDDDDDDESPEEEEEEEEEEVLGEPEDDEENEASPSPSSALAIADASTVVTLAMPGSSISNGDNDPILTTTASTILAADSSDPKRQRFEQIEEKKPLDDSRRLFQRLWTDEDEIGLLQGFLDYTLQRGSSHHNDTALFYDQIKSKLQLDFNKNQLVEKLRRLKKKYRNVLNKISSGKEVSFKSPHDQATFEISRKIWSNMGPVVGAAEDNALDDDEINPNPNFSHSMSKNEVTIGNSLEKRTPSSRKRPRSRSRSGMSTNEKRELNDGAASHKEYNCVSNTNTNYNNNHNIPGLIEETVRSCLPPLFKELQTSAMGAPFGARGFGGLTFSPMPLYTGGPSTMNFGSGEVVDDKWRKQHILELEVYSKRLELVQDQIKAALEELRSTGR